MHPFFLMPFANRSMISVLFFFMLASPWAFAQAETAEAPQSVEMTMKKMMSAIEADSLADFVSSGDAAFQAGMTKSCSTLSIGPLPRASSRVTPLHS